MLYKDALPLVKHIQKYIKGLYVSGSFKRKEEEINDLDFITKKKIDDLLDKFQYYYDIRILRQGNDYASIIIELPKQDLKIDIWRGDDNYQYKFLKWFRDIDKGHNIYYRKLAKEKGYILSDRGLKNIKHNYFMDFSNKKSLMKFLLK